MAYKRISPQPVVEGGTGAQTFTAYSVIAAGTTATGAFQNVVGVGTLGQVLTSAGPAALPAWQTLGASSISITGDTGGALTSGSFTFTGGTTGLSFGGAGSTETLTFAGITANGGTVSLATDATTSTINIGTGAGVKTSTFGSTNSTSATTVQSGSGALAVTSTNGTLTINSGTGVLAVSNDASATTINLGTGAAAKTVTLGSTNTTSTTTLQAGSGGVKLGAVAEGALVTSSTSVISTVTGTAGFVLTANAAGTAPSFQAAGVPAGVPQVARVSLTSAQIKALHATPITLIAAPGAGKSIIISELFSIMYYGGSNVFVAGASQRIDLLYVNGSGTTAVSQGVQNSTITSSANRSLLVTPTFFLNINPNLLDNQVIVAYNPIATEISGNAANDNTILFNILYYIVTL